MAKKKNDFVSRLEKALNMKAGTKEKWEAPGFFMEGETLVIRSNSRGQAVELRDKAKTVEGYALLQGIIEYNPVCEQFWQQFQILKSE